MVQEWNKETEEKFKRLIENLPQFHRNIAKQLVKEKAEELARMRNSQKVEDADLIKAFFNEVPPAFQDMMKRLFTQQGIAFEQYLSEKKPE